MYNNSFERLNAMFDCVPVKDRGDIPIYPQLITWAGRYAGKTQKEIFAVGEMQLFCIHYRLKSILKKASVKLILSLFAKKECFVWK